MFCSNSDPNQVVFGGKIFGESAVQFEQQIGLEVVHTFEVIQSRMMSLYGLIQSTVIRTYLQS